MKFSTILFYFTLFFLIISCAQKNNSKKENSIPKNDVAINYSKISRDTQNVVADTLKYCVAKGDVGAGGYDLVNYFTDNSAKIGDKNFTVNYDGLNYQFLNEKNKTIFNQNPKKYLPAFGGWCSMTLAMGRATTPTYSNFLISNDTLRLFEKTLSVNGKLLWQVDPVANKKQAFKNYEEYVDTGVIDAD